MDLGQPHRVEPVALGGSDLVNCPGTTGNWWNMPNSIAAPLLAPGTAAMRGYFFASL
jgi:hypothetical protein